MGVYVASKIRKLLLALQVDEVIRFSDFNKTAVHSVMRDLKEFGEDGNKYLYGSVSHYEAGQMVVVRLK